MEIRTKSGAPFKTEPAAKRALLDNPGYEALKVEGGWVCWCIDPTSSKLLRDSGKDVLCPGCGQSYHSTTEHYNPDIDANPAMLTLKEPYKSWGWTQMTNDPGMGYGCLECPDCGSALSPSGTLRIKENA